MVKDLVGKLKLVLPFIGLGILAYIVYSLDLQKIITAFLSIDPIYMVYALLLTIPLLVIRNVEWQIILKEQKITMGYLDSLKIYLIGIFYGSFTPGYSGQLMRIPYLKEKTGEPFGRGMRCWKNETQRDGCLPASRPAWCLPKECAGRWSGP